MGTRTMPSKPRPMRVSASEKPEAGFLNLLFAWDFRRSGKINTTLHSLCCINIDGSKKKLKKHARAFNGLVPDTGSPFFRETPPPGILRKV
jgi:hypothetical protein